jgi:hypothetical protein
MQRYHKRVIYPMIYISYKLISGINCKFLMSDKRQFMLRPPVLKKNPLPKTHTELTGGWESLTAILGVVLKRIFPRSPTEFFLFGL